MFMSSLSNTTEIVCLPNTQGTLWEAFQRDMHMPNIYLYKQINQLGLWPSAFQKRLNPPDH